MSEIDSGWGRQAEVAPEEVGLCSERLARIDQHLERRYLEPKKIAGTLTLIARRGKVAYVSPQGRLDFDRDAPMASDSLFRIYSMSKPVTSVALMTLYEHGHFQLDDAVRKYIPEWSNLRVYEAGSGPRYLTRPCEREMTIRDLFTHTSGLTYGFMERTNVDRAYRHQKIGGIDPDSTLRDMIERLARIPLEFSPGTAWNYSVATDVLGYLIEVISGQRLDDFLQQQIFEPLGMVDTGFSIPPDEAARLTSNYRREADKSLVLDDDGLDSRYARKPNFLSGGGGLVSTASDYLRFCQMLQNGGEFDGARILGPRTIELMTQNHLPGGADLGSLSVGLFSETRFDGTGFGLGFSVNLDPVRAQVISSAGEYAWGGAASTVFWIDPKEELIAIFLTQLMPSQTYNFRGQLKSIIYPAILD